MSPTTELLRNGHRSDDRPRSAMSEAPGLLIEMSDISTAPLGGLMGHLSCRTRPAPRTRGVGTRSGLLLRGRRQRLGGRRLGGGDRQDETRIPKRAWQRRSAGAGTKAERHLRQHLQSRRCAAHLAGPRFTPPPTPDAGASAAEVVVDAHLLQPHGVGVAGTVGGAAASALSSAHLSEESRGLRIMSTVRITPQATAITAERFRSHMVLE